MVAVAHGSCLATAVVILAVTASLVVGHADVANGEERDHRQVVDQVANATGGVGSSGGDALGPDAHVRALGLVAAFRARSNSVPEPVPQSGSLTHSGVATWSNFSQVWVIDYVPSEDRTPLISVQVPAGLSNNTNLVGVMVGQHCSANAWNVPLSSQ
jgi:hypothetical protein